MKKNDGTFKSEQELMLQAERYCAGSEHSVWQVSTKLQEWGAGSQDVVERIISRLIKENYIDQLRFAHAVVHDKLMFNKWGRIKIRFYLKNQKIDESTINKAMEQIEEKEYMDILKSVISGKNKSLKEKDKRLRAAKLMRSVVQCGFEPELVRSFVQLSQD
ncbi:MAG: RecX family transcriptional regulator [Bacteroidaceae bacterium]|nr:RecX family transcriptional regulator [Bacteroidaceae bacterium]